MQEQESRRDAYRRIERLSARDIRRWPEWMQKPITVRIRKTPNAPK